MDEQLRPALAARRDQHRYRKRRVVQSPQGAVVRVDGRELLCFCSNDYLGLANHPKLQQAAVDAIRQWGTGSGASHLITGHTALHETVEERVAAITGRERALLYSTGYMANIGVLGALAGKGDRVYQDALDHASLIDGARSRGAELVRFPHRDHAALAALLTADSGRDGRKLIAVDAVYSMDGDCADLAQLSAIARRHDAWLMADDAHGFGVLGERGAGHAETLDSDALPIYMATLGKALGGFGAFVAGSETLIETLIQFSRTYIYTTALPPAQAAVTLAGLELLDTEGWRREHLRDLIRRFRDGANTLGLPISDSHTAIQPLLIGDDDRALRASAYLENEGFWVAAIRPPTVPEGSARLRISLSAAHSLEQVDQLLDALAGLPS